MSEHDSAGTGSDDGRTGVAPASAPAVDPSSAEDTASPTGTHAPLTTDPEAQQDDSVVNPESS